MGTTTSSHPHYQERAWTAWLIGVAFVILVFGFQTGYAITKPDVAASLHLTAREVGLVGSVYTWCFALAQLVSGSLLDRAGARRVIPIATLLLAGGIFSFSQASSFATLLLSQVLVGMGASFGFVGAGFIGGAWFGMARYGLMFAFVQFIASTSAFFNQRLFDTALTSFSYQHVIGAMAASALLLAGIMVMFLKDPPGWELTHAWPRRPTEFMSHVLHDLKSVLVNIPSMWVVLVLGATSFAGMLSVGTVWGPDIAMIHNLTQKQANQVVPFAWLGLAFGAPTFAWLSDRLGKRKPLLLVSVGAQVVLLAIALLTTIESQWLVGLVLALIGFMAGGSMLPFTMAAELAGTKLAGTSAALVNGSQFVAGGVLMFLPGWLQDAMDLSIPHSILALPAVLAISLCLAPYLPETYRKTAPASR